MGRVVADVARKARTAAEEDVVPNESFHDARNSALPRNDQDGIESRRMVGGDHDALLVAQAIERANVANQKPGHLQDHYVEPKACANDKLA